MSIEEAARVHRLMGQSGAIEAILRLAAKIAPTSVAVLIEGESGTGKELLARVIHEMSLLREKPCTMVNCAAIPAPLVESEFFGHVKGAFTDAKTDHAGLFESNDGGTLVLDEVGELHLEFQAKLLRVLESGEVRRIGSTQSKNFSVRLITATNRDLAAEVEAGRFRRDLFYRINQFVFRMPALRERSEDVPLLVNYFMNEVFADLHPEVNAIAPDVMDLLRAYDYPGNIRELRNMIQRLKVLADPPLITSNVLPREVVHAALERFSVSKTRGEDPPKPSLSNDVTLTTSLQPGYRAAVADCSRAILLTYLRLSEGRVKEAARMAEVPLATFYRKLEEAGIATPARSGKND